MYKTLYNKISKFVLHHPKVAMYGLSIGIAFGIALVVSSMNPHEAFADWVGHGHEDVCQC